MRGDWQKIPSSRWTSQRSPGQRSSLKTAKIDPNSIFSPIRAKAIPSALKSGVLFVIKCSYLLCSFVSCFWNTKYNKDSSNCSDCSIAPEDSIESNQNLQIRECLTKSKVNQPRESNSKRIKLTSNLKLYQSLEIDLKS